MKQQLIGLANSALKLAKEEFGTVEIIKYAKIIVDASDGFSTKLDEDEEFVVATIVNLMSILMMRCKGGLYNTPFYSEKLEHFIASIEEYIEPEPREFLISFEGEASVSAKSEEEALKIFNRCTIDSESSEVAINHVDQTGVEDLDNA